MGNESFKRAAAETGSDAAPPIDLSDYYQGPNDPAIEADMQSVKTAAAGFAAKYKGNLAALSPDELARAYEETDALLDVWTRIGGYSDFIMAMNAQDEDAKALESKIRSFAAETSNLLVFFDLELAKIDEADLHRAIAASPALARYEPAITNLLKNKPHMLSEPEEKILTIADTTGASAWARYFTEKMSRITLPFDGAETDLESILSSTMVADRETRRKAFTGLTEGLARVEFDTTFALNVIAEEKREHDKLRNYAQAPSARNLSNNIEDDVIDALNKSVTSSYARLSHRFYALKAEYMGLAQLEPWDRNAPMAADDEDMTFGEARKLVIDTYTAFSPDMGAIAKEFFDKRWIDATQRKGKAGGAFAMPGPVSIHPLQFINWLDKRNDVSTLAHETGHNIHQRLAAQHTKSQILSDTPLTLAETASVFGEKLTFERVLAQEKDPTKRVALLFGKLDDTINTVVRQIAFHNFELGVHNKVRDENRSLTTQEINEIFIETQRAALGPAIKIDERTGPLWSYVSHFFENPFYVSSYAVGDCLVNALYRQYETAPDKAAFAEKYVDLLKAGGTKHHTEALAPFGIDLRDPAFWDKGMDVFADMIDRLDREIALEKTMKAGAAPQPRPSKSP